MLPHKGYSISKCTAEGQRFAQQKGETAELQPGIHYIAQPGDDHVMLQDVKAIGSLPHRYIWVKRRVPVVPVWSHAKLPNSRYSPEENCRLLSIYFRPWTLDPNGATADNLLLAKLGNCPPSACGSSNPVASYRLSWSYYIDGRVVSELSRRYIVAKKGSNIIRRFGIVVSTVI